MKRILFLSFVDVGEDMPVMDGDRKDVRKMNELVGHLGFHLINGGRKWHCDKFLASLFA